MPSTASLVHSFIHSFIYSFIHPSTRPFIHSSFRPLIRPSIQNRHSYSSCKIVKGLFDGAVVTKRRSSPRSFQIGIDVGPTTRPLTLQDLLTQYDLNFSTSSGEDGSADRSTTLERWTLLDATLRFVLRVGTAFARAGETRQARSRLEQGARIAQGFCLPRRCTHTSPHTHTTRTPHHTRTPHLTPAHTCLQHPDPHLMARAHLTATAPHRRHVPTRLHSHALRLQRTGACTSRRTHLSGHQATNNVCVNLLRGSSTHTHTHRHTHTHTHTHTRGLDLNRK